MTMAKSNRRAATSPAAQSRRKSTMGRNQLLVLKELLLLWITVTTRYDNATDLGANTADQILQYIAGEYNKNRGKDKWNWDNLTPELAKALLERSRNNAAVHLNVATEFQGNLKTEATDSNGNLIPSVADSNAWDPTQHDHPSVAELMAALGLQ